MASDIKVRELLARVGLGMILRSRNWDSPPSLAPERLVWCARELPETLFVFLPWARVAVRFAPIRSKGAHPKSSKLLVKGRHWSVCWLLQWRRLDSGETQPQCEGLASSQI